MTVHGIQVLKLYNKEPQAMMKRYIWLALLVVLRGALSALYGQY
jgi:hypothetical protein